MIRIGEVAQMGERELCKLEAAGSIPVFSTKFLQSAAAWMDTRFPPAADGPDPGACSRYQARPADTQGWMTFHFKTAFKCPRNGGVTSLPGPQEDSVLCGRMEYRRHSDTYSHPVAGGGVDGAKRNGEPAEVATIRGASAGAKAGQTCHCGLAGHGRAMIGPFGHAQRPREAAAGEIPAPQSHRRLHQAVSAEQSPTVRRFTVAPRIPLSGDCSLVAQLRGAGRLVGAALRFFSIRHQLLFHAASVAHSGVRVLSKQRG